MPQFTAVVHDAHGARFVAAARSRRQREAQVVDYIRERCDYVLWPSAAENVRELIARDRKSAAIAAYFANVGQRWDDERLELLDSDVPNVAACIAGTGVAPVRWLIERASLRIDLDTCGRDTSLL